MTVAVTLPPSPAPSRQDPVNFEARGDAYHAWLVPAVAQMNAQNAENNTLNADVNTKADQVSTSATASADSAAAAGVSATASFNSAATATERATAALVSQNAAATSQTATAASAATATTQAALATTQANNAVAVVTGGTASLTALAGRIPIADAQGELDATWMTGIANNNYPTIRPTLDLDFINGATVDPRITCTRASTTTYYDGKTFAKAEENLLLNSAVLVTQSTTTRAEPYTLTFEGTGTVTLSGTSTAGPLVGTGTTNRVTLTFTPTAGTLTLTVTGDVTKAQLEARSTATAYTATTTQPITRFQPVLLTAPANTAVIDHDPVTGARLGLRIWEARTNLLLRSSEFDDAYWVKTSNGTGVAPVVIQNQAISPDGTQTADRVQFNSGASGTSQLASATLTGTAGVVYIFSIWMRSLSGNVLVTLFNTSGTTNVTVTGSWQRFTYAATAGTSTLDARLALRDTWGTTGSADLLIWGAQLEAGSTASPYIPTTAAQVTRAADNLSMTGANFSSWYRQDEGSFLCAFFRSYPTDNVTLNGRLIGFDAAPGGILGVANLDKVEIPFGAPTIAAGTFAAGSFPNAAVSYSGSGRNICLNGGTVAESSALVPVINSSIRLGARGDNNSTAYLNGHIRRITYYPARLPSATLQAITKP